MMMIFYLSLLQILFFISSVAIYNFYTYLHVAVYFD